MPNNVNIPQIIAVLAAAALSAGTASHFTESYAAETAAREKTLAEAVMQNQLRAELEKAEKQAEKELDSGFRYVFSLGQKPLIKNKISVEDTAKLNGKILKSNAEILSETIKKFGYDCYISHNAGTSFCSKLYYFGLNYIAENKIKTDMFFLHVPFAENCNMDIVAEVLDKSINLISKNQLEQCL